MGIKLSPGLAKRIIMSSCTPSKLCVPIGTVYLSEMALLRLTNGLVCSKFFPLDKRLTKASAEQGYLLGLIPIFLNDSRYGMISSFCLTFIPSNFYCEYFIYLLSNLSIAG